MTIVNLSQERSKREGPDEDCISRDDYGRALFHYLVDYELDGKDYSVTITAPDWAEAERHASALRRGAIVAGQLIGMGPA